MKIPEITILAIESSCDDTGVAVIKGNQVLSNLVANQEIHSRYGGVVPELASRAHLSNITPTVDLALKDAGISHDKIDAVAYTIGPGLNGSLLVGTSFAKAWAWANDLPTVPVHHMRAHILAHFLAPNPAPDFPFLCMTVSGGHTQIVHVHSPSKMEVIGTTLDDAAGEAFDKVAKLIGLPYPGGPLIDKYAALGNPDSFSFSGSRVDGLDMSFSGLKTQVLRFLQKNLKSDPNFIDNHLNDFCASVQTSIVAMLISKLELAVEKTGITQVAIAGGVSANSGLRKALQEKSELESEPWIVFIPPLKYCTDNAAMVGMVGVFDAADKKFGTLSDTPKPRMPELTPSSQ
ncbi:MAG TPA: tRNA (adenosine(37)-N6)-threonylcarbamoyltransferase complex transferase subunit TsaD [Flavobacteriales bacterium]|jgi:N6-L-threonylcarbamoyladenine synthase|nr:tRNA (adenosine(37)-N6)-threonylcarbamoyltransferase complex transferase subunit TsaD [Flavobacteriales bacterium]HIN41151.1 tRNA (adenosine(37)-N6)-threonylcarbamoyltransferase complex transferase subunit TsaD [Flavobacteriales bacterium]HIO16257.1 tRNA (adenosine(37)-N6)-threonylcarbamoyltransferase complex transferase subunit TsaD [Flavobacteriales bacterium]HIO59505.1 tRNA (adenosine(37)-N6)-threonylcarbamoyltransferase complex transferase subunit TsaD [Flavobacteriales bacterium]